MQNNRKHLDIPYLPELDSMSLDEAVKYLDEKGERQVIDNLNWKDQYPYRPLTAFTIAHSDTQIYIDFFTRCNYLRAVNDKNNSDVYQDSCVEVFWVSRSSLLQLRVQLHRHNPRSPTHGPPFGRKAL